MPCAAPESPVMFVGADSDMAASRIQNGGYSRPIADSPSLSHLCFPTAVTGRVRKKVSEDRAGSGGGRHRGDTRCK